MRRTRGGHRANANRAGTELHGGLPLALGNTLTKTYCEHILPSHKSTPLLIPPLSLLCLPRGCSRMHSNYNLHPAGPHPDVAPRLGRLGDGKDAHDGDARAGHDALHERAVNHQLHVPRKLTHGHVLRVLLHPAQDPALSELELCVRSQQPDPQRSRRRASIVPPSTRYQSAAAVL